ncbi:MAG: SIS domain-containing protein [Chloroflexi bacterium]|nr:SIS domain-containing protein [Chloroflexota bacterium]
MKNKEFINEYFEALQRVGTVIPHPQIDKVIELLFEVWKDGNSVFAMGNGGSASTASHFVCDLAKTTTGGGKRRFKVMGLTDNIPLVSAWTNDSGFASIFAEQLVPWLSKGDVLVGFSVHGGSGESDAGPWSQNMVRAMAMAKERKAKIIGFSGFNGGAMKEMSDVCIVVPVDSEPLGTPLVESFHVILHHLICTALKAKIAGAADE